MSVDHKRPLLAFAVVTIACAAILVNAVRSEAFVSLLRAETSHVVAGLGLAPADHRPAHRPEGEPETARLVDAPAVVAAVQHPRPAQPQAHRTPTALPGVPARPVHPAHEDHAHEHGKHARGHGGDPDGRRVHRHGRESGHHHGRGDHADQAPEDGDRADGDLSRANARVLGHSRAADLRR